jgi:hypothetical protein
MKGRDYMIRKIFSNFSVTGKTVTKYELTEPYKTFIAKGFVTHGRPVMTVLELYGYFTTNLEFVNQFNSEMFAFLRGEKVFVEPEIVNLRL